MVRSIAILAALLLVPDLSFASEPGAVREGERLRIRMREWRARPLTGVLIGASGDSIVLRPDGGSADLTLARLYVDQLEVSQGMGPNWLGGATVGLLAGAGIGALWGAQMEPDIVGRSGNVVVGAMLLGGAGLVVGVCVGTLVRVEKWARVPAEAISAAGE